MLNQKNIRNIAIIAHVDHGKTTLVDAMLKQSGIFRENQEVEERIMDSNDLERERGITILAKNTSLHYENVKINIIDTPGHADFGGEVERSLKMANGVLLLVDAFEGCMPQTRFVLKKALDLQLAPVIVINKVDRPMARPLEVVDEVLELLLDLGASDEQLDSPVVYASAKDGWASLDPEEEGADLKPLFDTILSAIPHPEGDMDGDLQLLVSNIDYDGYTGRIAVGRIDRGQIHSGDQAVICRKNGTTTSIKLSNLYVFQDLQRIAVEEAGVGDIVAVSGIKDINIGETICCPSNIEPLPFVEIDEPVLSMTFCVNKSPFAGQDGDYVTSRHLRDRLFRELESNISLRVEETDSPDAFVVSGRGELHLSVLIENMRRQGYEFAVSKPQVITKMVNGQVWEPIETLTVDLPDDYTGVLMEGAGIRKAEMLNMTPTQGGYSRLEFLIPSRGLIGYRSQLMTETKGTAIMNHVFHGYEPFKGEMQTRTRGSLIAHETGDAVTYGLYNAQDRGILFIGPGTKVYEGMIVGESSRQEDIVVNVCKKKHVTNTRSATADEALRLTPPKPMSLEQCLEFISDDELVEITPKNIRMRKEVLEAGMRAKVRR
ncbi:translational GTPase TypA [Bianquea renquensis]|jgi:GTP-binding protein TypA|uniref:Large ribosomal subunit assembly factor BipA n=1 Tax=Bianquea renquensis TaxID=2763661 RepID=A0A926DRT0_9FIRM|nr:translational GTPase TypA [Bianquea renquensis]MBC8542848.1 translational GTPase TypA [Bianquea renquensis]